jgi:methionine-rich copper-binding protein CopC
MKRLLAAFLAVSFIGISQQPALAHASLVQAQPSVSSVVEKAPQFVRLTFDDDLQEIPGVAANVIEVLNSEGAHFEVGSTQLQGATLSVATDSKALISGEYSVIYRVISADGHPVSGSYDFKVQAGVEPSSPAGSQKPTQAASHLSHPTPALSTSMPDETPISSTTSTAQHSPKAANINKGENATSDSWSLTLIAIAVALTVGLSMLFSAKLRKSNS